MIDKMQRQMERIVAEQSDDRDELRKLALVLFHRLWSKDRDTTDYVKTDWVALQLSLNKLGVKV